MIPPLALEAVRRIDALFEIQQAINDQAAKYRKPDHDIDTIGKTSKAQGGPPGA